MALAERTWEHVGDRARLIGSTVVASYIKNLILIKLSVIGRYTLRSNKELLLNLSLFHVQ